MSSEMNTLRAPTDLSTSPILLSTAPDADASDEEPKATASHKGRSYARCCCAVTTVAAVTAAVAGVAFQFYGNEIIGAYSNLMHHT